MGRPASDAPAASTASSSGSTPIVAVTVPSLSPDESPSAPDIASIKRQCAVSILSLVPRPIARRFFGLPSANATEYAPPDRQADDHLRPPSLDNSHSQHPESSRTSTPASPASSSSPEELLLLAAIEEDILDLFADSFCNKYLIYSIIETILVKLLPELSERSLTELMEDRGVSLVSG